MRSRAADAALAALATMVAAWPLSTLLERSTWVQSSLLLVAVVALSGIGARLLALRGWQVVAAQLVVAVLAAGGLYGRGHLWHGLPTLDTARAAGTLIGQAVQTIQSYSAPAPTTRGITVLVGCSLALVALLVDYLAVTRRSPSLAGLPLMATFLSAAANSGGSLSPVFFLAAAAVWLVLVARQGTFLLRRWSTTIAAPLTPVRATVDAYGGSTYATVARSLGAAALAVAVALPVALPHLPTRFLLAGLGRNDAAAAGNGSVGFSQSLNLTADLNNRNATPVLTFRTNDPSPPPLRVSVSSSYRDGEWRPQREGAEEVGAQRRPDVDAPTGLAPEVARRRYQMAVTSNVLREPNLAAPYPLTDGDLRGVRWGLEPLTQTALVERTPSSYEVSYYDINPTRRQLEQAGTELPGSAPAQRYLRVDPRSASRVADLNKRLLRDDASPYEHALAIQDYLRTSGGFTYSLTLTPARDSAGRPTDLDPLSNFLVTKQGYCVQFATAMIMMARSAGIPARIAIGFLPGSAVKGLWTVTAADAHAWPELYLDGIGWTRFEPTPAVRSGAPPIYAGDLPVDTPNAGSGREVDPRTGALRLTNPKQDTLDRADDARQNPVAPLPVTPVAEPSLADRLPRGWALGLLTLLAGLLGGLVVPTAAAWHRRSRRRSASTPAEVVEAEWESLTSRLADLGMPAPPSRTPRQLRDFYDREAFLAPDAAEALGRVVQTLERSRYARPSAQALSIEPDAEQVLRAVAVSRRRQDRVRAAVWPDSGVAALRMATGRLSWGVRAPARSVREWVRRRRT
jgi:transglutaminase-like putative cysteine protease